MTSTPPGWHVDPENEAQWRWWDGTDWSEHRSARITATTRHPDANAEPLKPYSVESLIAPDGTDWNTAWIWWVVVLSVLPSFGLLAMDWNLLFDFSDPTGMKALTFIFSPVYLLTLVAGWLSYGLSVWFSYLDYRELERRGVPRPFHWAWCFLGSSIYVIGRSVIVKRRTGRGLAPMWAEIAGIIAAVGVAIYVTTVMMVAIIDGVRSTVGELGI